MRHGRHTAIAWRRSSCLAVQAAPVGRVPSFLDFPHFSGIPKCTIYGHLVARY